MFSYKSLFIRAFFMCKECDFVWTTLGQANHTMEGCCPSCGEDHFDYAPPSARDKFIKGIREELQVFERELADE